MRRHGLSLRDEGMIIEEASILYGAASFSTAYEGISLHSTPAHRGVDTSTSFFAHLIEAIILSHSIDERLRFGDRCLHR